MAYGSDGPSSRKGFFRLLGLLVDWGLDSVVVVGSGFLMRFLESFWGFWSFFGSFADLGAFLIFGKHTPYSFFLAWKSDSSIHALKEVVIAVEGEGRAQTAPYAASGDLKLRQNLAEQREAHPTAIETAERF